MAEAARQDVMDVWRGLGERQQRSVLTMLRTKKQFAADEVPLQAAADALEALRDQEVLRLTREVVEAYASLHECVVYQMRGSYVTTDVQHQLDRLEHLGIISAAGSVSDEVADRGEAAVVRVLSKALDRHKAHGAAGLAELAAEQIADLKRQLRRYDMTQQMLDKLVDKWKAHVLKRKRELKKLRRQVVAAQKEEQKRAAAVTSLRFWLTELVEAVSTRPEMRCPTPDQVVDDLEKQFPGWRG